MPPDMFDNSKRSHKATARVPYTDGTNIFWVACRAVVHLEKVVVRKTYIGEGDQQIEDVSKRKTYGRKVTTIRIANIREPFNGTQFKIERVASGEQGSKLIEWGLTPVITEE